MATTTLQPGAAPAKTSRRALLGILATGPIAMLPPFAAYKIGSAEAASPSEWSEAVAIYRTATEAFSRATHIHSAAEEQYFAIQPERPTFTMEVEGDYGKFGKHTLPITIYAEDLDDPTKEWADPARMEGMRTQLAAYRLADADARKRFNVDVLEEASVDAMHRQSEALERLIAVPVPNYAALLEKISIILAEYDDQDGTTTAVMADVRRLAGEASHV